MEVRGKRIPLPLVSVAAVALLMIGVYAPGYIWKVEWRIDQLTSFEVCRIKLPGGIAGDFLLVCQHVEPRPIPPPGIEIGERVVVHRLVWPLTPAVTIGGGTTSTYVVLASANIPAGGFGAVIANCNPGDFATGGGHPANTGLVTRAFSPWPAAGVPTDGTYVTIGIQPEAPGAWRYSADNPTASDIAARVYAVCLKPDTVGGQSPSTYVVLASASIPAGGFDAAIANCNPGDFATGGGHPANTGLVTRTFMPWPAAGVPTDGTYVTIGIQPEAPGAWRYSADNPTASDIAARVYAVCLKPVSGEAVVVPPQLVPPEEMLELAGLVGGKVEVLDERQATIVEMATLAGFKELRMPAALLAVVPPPGVTLPPQRYHEFIRVDRRLAITFSIPEADRIAAAQAWVQLLFGFYIFDCVRGTPVPVPPFGGNYVQVRVVNRDQQPDPMGSFTIVLSPGLYCVNKMIWGETKPIIGEAFGTLTVVVTARPA